MRDQPHLLIAVIMGLLQITTMNLLVLFDCFWGGGMNLMKLALMGLVASLAACATAPEQIKLEGFSAVETPSFTLVDARSMENVRGGVNENSYSVWWVYGDDKISPPPLTVVRSGLARALGAEFAGKTIKVEKLEISLVRIKAQARAPGSVYAPSSGSFGGDILAGFLAGFVINAIEGAKGGGPTISTEMVLDVDGKKIEHWEREHDASGELDRRLAANLVKAVDEVALKIRELFNPKIPEQTISGSIP